MTLREAAHRRARLGAGLVVLVCLPLIGSLLAGVLMIVAGLSARRQGSLAAINGSRAANWGLTYSVVTVVHLGISAFGLIRAAGGGEVPPIGVPVFRPGAR